MSWNRFWLALMLAATAVGFGAQLVTCSPVSTAEPNTLTTAKRSTLPDSPMTTQNDLITTASHSTTSLTAKKPAPSRATTAGGARVAAETTSSWDTSSTAPTITTTRAVAVATKSAQIGLTMAATTVATTAHSPMAAALVATPTKTITTSTTTTETMFISTIYPTAAEHQTVVKMAASATASEADANNSIEMATSPESSEENAVLLLPHPGNADSLTKGFSIPTFLPPFPVFAAADLPALRAAADAAEATAAAMAAAAAAAASSTATSETVALSPEQQRQQMFNEQHLYLASHNGQELGQGQMPRRNLTMPVLNITEQMGNHAYMPCQIHRLSNKPVSWVRLRDGHIISVDETTFIADERFQSIFQEEHDYTWSLQIKYAQENDSGWYECQMATEPKLSAKVHLEIVTPKTELIGDQSRFVKAGSKVALHCIVRGTLDPPKYIIWFRGQKKVSESDDKTGWYTQIDRNIFGNVGDNQNTIGSLIIPFVRKEDSGNYTCQPSNSNSVSVDLHVLSGEYSASAIMSAAERPQLSTFLLPTLAIALELLLLPWPKT